MTNNHVSKAAIFVETAMNQCVTMFYIYVAMIGMCKKPEVTEHKPHVQNQLQHALFVGATEAVHTTTFKETGASLTKESSMSQNHQQHLLTVEHANAPSGDAKDSWPTSGSSSSHSSHLPSSKQPISPPPITSLTTSVK